MEAESNEEVYTTRCQESNLNFYLVQIYIVIMSPLQENQPVTIVETEIQSKKRKRNAPTSTTAKKPKLSEPTPTLSIRVDPELYQAIVGPYVEPPPVVDSVPERDVREEPIWINPPASHDETLQNCFFRAIHRQFDGHVPQELAMEHLMTKNWNVLAALETIDEVLMGLSEPAVAMLEVKHLFLEPLFMDHHVEEEAADWDSFKFSQADCSEFFDFRRRAQSSNPQEHPVDFEPRWSCTNCTKSRRTESRLCLICQAYQKLSDGTRRPLSMEPHFFKHEQSKISEWKRMEKREKREVPRMEFEKEQEVLETQRLERIRAMRYPREELPKEEVETVKKYWNLRIERVRRINRMRPWVNKDRVATGKDPLPPVEVPARFETLRGPRFAELLTMRRPGIQKTQEEKPKDTMDLDSKTRRKRTCGSIFAR